MNNLKTYKTKEQNKALLGTLHKVSGPQNADVRIKESTLEMIKRATIGNLFSGITHVPALFLPILTSASYNRGYRKAFANAQTHYEL